jgi:hypothetical protein
LTTLTACALQEGRSGARGPAVDHWHRTERDKGRPYDFKDAETLVDDFFAEVERVLTEHGVPFDVLEVDDEGAEEIQNSEPRRSERGNDIRGKLEAVGFVHMKTVKRRKVPTTSMRPLRIRIDPFSMNDRLER